MATRRALARLVDVAIESAANFVVIAGDLFDGEWRDCNTGLYFVSPNEAAARGRYSGLYLPRQSRRGQPNDARSALGRRRPLLRPSEAGVRRGRRARSDALQPKLSKSSYRRGPHGRISQGKRRDVQYRRAAHFGNILCAGRSCTRPARWKASDPTNTNTGHWDTCIPGRSWLTIPGWSSPAIFKAAACGSADLAAATWWMWTTAAA